MLRPLLVFGFTCALSACTSNQVQLARQGQLCDYVEQCQPPLGCACVVKAQTDPDGYEQILQHGFCQPKDFDNAKCPTPDGGFDANRPDVKSDADGAAETSDETSDAAGDAETESETATDAGAE